MDLTFGDWHVAFNRVAPPSDQLAATYDAISPRWQQIITRLNYPQAYADLVGQLRRDGWLTGVSAQARALDCGIGTGALSVALLQHLPLRQIDGVDIAPHMLNEAQQRVRAAGATLNVHTNDIQTLPFDDATFDLVMSAHALEHLSDPCDGVREMVRVARPGAPVIVIMTRPGPGGALLQARWGITCVQPTTIHSRLVELDITPVCQYELSTRWCRHHSFVLVGLKRS